MQPTSGTRTSGSLATGASLDRLDSALRRAGGGRPGPGGKHGRQANESRHGHAHHCRIDSVANRVDVRAVGEPTDEPKKEHLGLDGDQVAMIRPCVERHDLGDASTPLSTRANSQRALTDASSSPAKYGRLRARRRGQADCGPLSRRSRSQQMPGDQRHDDKGTQTFGKADQAVTVRGSRACQLVNGRLLYPRTRVLGSPNLALAATQLLDNHLRALGPPSRDPRMTHLRGALAGPICLTYLSRDNADLHLRVSWRLNLDWTGHPYEVRRPYRAVRPQ